MASPTLVHCKPHSHGTPLNPLAGEAQAALGPLRRTASILTIDVVVIIIVTIIIIIIINIAIITIIIIIIIVIIITIIITINRTSKFQDFRISWYTFETNHNAPRIKKQIRFITFVIIIIIISIMIIILILAIIIIIIIIHC